MQEYQLYINGEYSPSSSGKIIDDYNPYNGEVFAKVHQANNDDLERTLAAAQNAFASWKDVLPAEKEAIFIRAAEIARKRADEIKQILVHEGGSTLLKAGYEAHHTPLHMVSMSGECRRVIGETFISDYPGVKSYSIRRPLGVVTAISPFNFPLLLANRKVGWAIAAGNTVVLKPSEQTPVICLLLAEIYSEAGLPAGVLNVIPANASDLGDTLITDPRVKKITFTGSTAVGKLIATKAAQYNKKVTLEMGGKNPIIILNDADIDYAVNTTAFSNYIHQGQVCMTGSRVIVEAGIYDEFCETLATKVTNIKYGNPTEPGVIVGPLIRDTQATFIQQQVDDAVSKGASLDVGGSSEGNVYVPTLLTDVTPSMSIFRTECFGPVASVIKANDYQHAIDIANDSEYGLTSAVHTNDLQKAIAISEALESGMVHINGPSIRDEPIVPFGGVKNSGMGREGGRYGMEEFTELKWITIQTDQQKYPF